MADNFYHEYALFTDVKDKALAARNRGVVLANIIEDNSDDKWVLTKKGKLLCLNYSLRIPSGERKAMVEFASTIIAAKGASVPNFKM